MKVNQMYLYIVSVIIKVLFQFEGSIIDILNFLPLVARSLHCISSSTIIFLTEIFFSLFTPLKLTPFSPIATQTQKPFLF